MTNWVQIGVGPLTGDWWETLQALCAVRDDETDIEWFDLDSGCSVVLACDGGWRDAAASRFRLFHRAATGVVTELSELLGPPREAAFDASQRGSDSYSRVLTVLEDRVEALLRPGPGPGWR